MRRLTVKRGAIPPTVSVSLEKTQAQEFAARRRNGVRSCFLPGKGKKQDLTPVI